MKVDEIRTIVKLMSENDLTEFKIESDEYNLCIRRGSNSPAVVSSAPVVTATTAAEATPVAAPVSKEVAPEVEEEPSETITAPLVGTFYRASSPESAPFVKVGDRVDPETVIGIIEAMKVMNEIKAEKSGVIKDILVENSQAVEYGQPLIVIE